MKKKLFKSYWLLILVILAASIGVICHNPKAVAPQSMQSLDLSLTKNDFYLDEENYENEMKEIVIPYLEKYKQKGYFTSDDNAQLYYEQYLQENAKAHIVISHGYSENSQKYKEVIYYFLKEGYNVSILDHRGHGYSDSMINDPSKIYIDSYTTYINDLKTFMDNVVTIGKEENYLLYAHSMGGAIGSLFIETYPDYFTCAVLSSPMMKVETGSYPDSIAKLIAISAVNLGFKNSLIFGEKPFEGIFDFKNSCTTSEVRYNHLNQLRIDNIELQQNAGTFGWLKASLDATTELINNAEQATLPILLFQAENDTLVQPSGHYAFAEKAPHTQIVYVNDTKHEIYNATNEIFIPYFSTILQFYNEILTQ